MRLARFARKTLTPRFTDFFTDFEEKNRLFCNLWVQGFGVVAVCGIVCVGQALITSDWLTVALNTIDQS